MSPAPSRSSALGVAILAQTLLCAARNRRAGADYYATLGVEERADAGAIKKACLETFSRGQSRWISLGSASGEVVERRESRGNLAFLFNPSRALHPPRIWVSFHRCDLGRGLRALGSVAPRCAGCTNSRQTPH